MRAVVYSSNGGPEVLTEVDRVAPDPGPGEVRVRLVRSGVNPTDWKVRSGATGTLGFPEQVPGLDGAGVVDAVGSQVDGLTDGDRVWVFGATVGRPSGTAQEQVVLPASLVAPLPDAGSFDVGAALGVPGVTAHRALTVSEGGPTRLGPGTLEGRVVLVAGGAGAVGNAAIQLARWSGARVLTTVSSDEKAALATAAGAHTCVDYTRGDTEAALRDLAPDGVDIVVEVAPAQNLPLDLALVRTRGTIAFYANDGGDTVELDVRSTFATNARLQGVFLYTVGDDAWRAAADDLTAAVADGAYAVGEEHGLPLHHFPLADVAAAHRAVEDGVVGKVLVDVAAG